MGDTRDKILSRGVIFLYPPYVGDLEFTSVNLARIEQEKLIRKNEKIGIFKRPEHRKQWLQQTVRILNNTRVKNPIALEYENNLARTISEVESNRGVLWNTIQTIMD